MPLPPLLPLPPFAVPMVLGHASPLVLSEMANLPSLWMPSPPVPVPSVESPPVALLILALWEMERSPLL